MTTIDDKVVALSFESSKFEQGIDKSIKALEKLKASLKMPDVGKGLENVSGIFQKFNLGRLGKGIDEVSNKLKTFHLVAIGVLSNLAAQAVRTGLTFVKSLTLDPIKQGLDIYQTKLQSIQTVLANTAAQGTKMADVTKALNELNKYSNQTIYNFGQMAKNIGTFTAAGVDLKTATASIKGIANLAALSGSSADQASVAMYQLSQAIAAGRVSLQDWNSVVNAGMGGAVFQKALAQTAEAMGALKKGSVELVGPMKQLKINGESFRQSIGGPGPKWLTSDILTKTLEQFTGDLSAAQLKAEGFNEAQIKAIQAQAKVALHAATQVKTIGQVFDIAKETAATGWATTFEIIFGGLNEAKALFTGVSNAINGFIQRNADARNKVLQDWKDLGGRTVLIDSIKTAFLALGAVLKPIKQAFRDIFPAATGKQLYDLTLRFQDFVNRLKPSAETVDGLRRTFRGIFAVLDIGKQVITGIFGVFKRLFDTLTAGQGSFLQITARIGDWLVALDEALKKGNRLNKFFDGLGNILAVPIQLIGRLKDALASLFSGFSSGGFSDQVDGMTQSLNPFQRIMSKVIDVWSKFLDSFSKSGDILKPAFEAISNFFLNLGPAISQAVSGMNFEAILQTLRTGLFGALVIMLKNFFGRGSLAEQLGGMGAGIFQNISGSFKALEGSMVAMQQNIKAKTLKEIAIAIGILAASIVALSFVDPKKLNSSLAAITVGFGELLGAMAILDKIGKAGGFIKLPFIAGSLILLAGAIDVLAIAVIALSQLNWNELVKGLGGIGFLLTALSAASVPLSANASGMVRAGIGITAIAVALKILASAVSDFGGMSMTELGKGLGSVAVGLGILAASTNLLPKGLVLQGTGLIAIAFALKLLGDAVSKFGGLNWTSIGKGMASIAGALFIIAAAMQLMPTNMVITAAGLLLVSVALGKIANAVQSMGGMSVKQIAKGLISLAAALTILAVALYAMSGTLAGAAALAIAAAGLALLAPALTALGKQSWGQILKGLITLAAALTILGIAGALITPVIPSLLGLGAALILLGAGLALAGAGIALIGVGLSAIAVAGPTAIGILLKAIEDLLLAIPKLVENLVLSLLAIVDGLAKTAPKFVDALVQILNSLVDVIIKASPKIAEAFTALLTAALKVLHDNQPKIIQAGFDLLLALLNGIKNNIGQLVSTVGDIVAKFLATITNNLNKIINAGQQVLLSLVRGIANRLADVISTAVDIVTKFIGAITNNLGRIVTAGLTMLSRLLGAIASRIGDVIKTGTDVVVGFITGVGNAGGRIVKAAVEAMAKFIAQIAKSAVKLADEGAKAIILFLNGVAATIEARAPEIRAAGFRIGIAIVDGMTGGMASKAGELASKAKSLASSALGAITGVFKSHSPSEATYEIGQFVVLGLANGMADNSRAVSAAEDLGNSVITAFNDLFQITSPSKVMYEIGQYVGQGFAQGLRGSGDDIKNAFQDLNNKLTDSMRTARETIVTEQKKLNELRAANKPDQQAIKEAQQAIEENQNILARATAGHKALITTLKDEKKELLGLSADYVDISNKLKDAKQALLDATRTRDEAIKGFTDQYATLPDIVTKDAEGNAIDQLATYEDALKHQADAVGAYQATLDQLRKLGLDDATYQKLVQEGTADKEFATQLLSGGKTAVDALNVLDAQLMRVSKTLATNAGNNLYQAGVDAAAGLVKGLQSKENELRKAMVNLANEIVDTLKKQLKIKSPSEIFAEIGRYSMEGLAAGFTDSSQIVTDAVDDAAKDALAQMRQSMSDISDIVTEELDPNPVITPILDLTQVQAQRQELAALTNVTPITAATSFGQASAISSEQTAAQPDETVVAPGGTSVKFEQNNYSPESLSEVEIYRQTKNQLSQLKTVLGVT